MRDKKINLNYPLPVSNDPNEPVRQKWISETYQLLKAILPPMAVDTPEELAQLSQFVINIIDFRDPDGTMTHWVNPDVVMSGVLSTALTTGTVAVTKLPAVTLQYTGYMPPAPPLTNPVTPPTTTWQLDQYGMEYNPVALNEVLAYSYQYLNSTKAITRANRFFIELVNTLTSPELCKMSPDLLDNFNASINLGGYGNTAASTDPYSGEAGISSSRPTTPTAGPIRIAASSYRMPIRTD